MRQFGEDPEIDLLIFTSYLIDYGRNYYPACLTAPRAGKLWQAMNLDRLNRRDDQGNLLRDPYGNPQPDTTRYASGIDNAIVYSLLRWYMKTYNKPMLLSADNHGAYTLPYGISPRLRFAQDWQGMTPGRELRQEENVEITKQRRDANQAKQHRDEIGVGRYDKRANEGSAADHNLTIPEATLWWATRKTPV